MKLHSVPDIYIFGIGAEIYESDLKPLTAGTGGDHFFKMRDITNLQETFDEIIGMLPPTLTSPLKEAGLSLTFIWFPQMKKRSLVCAVFTKSMRQLLKTAPGKCTLGWRRL